MIKHINDMGYLSQKFVWQEVRRLLTVVTCEAATPEEQDKRLLRALRRFGKQLFESRRFGENLMKSHFEETK